MSKIFPRILCVLAMIGIAAGPARAQETNYPTKRVRVLVGFAAGGGLDVLARALATKLSTKLGQPMIVENIVGVAGAIMAQRLATEAPDGYTIAVAASSALVINVHMNPKPSYDTLKDFQPIILLVNQDGALVVNNDLPIKSFPQFLQYAKDNPGKLSFGTPGLGSIGHIGGEILKKAAGINMLNVPYKGDGPLATDLIAGTIPAGIIAIPAAAGMIKAGQFRAIALLGTERSRDFPDLPTIVELGYPTATVQPWIGLIAPAGVPGAIVNKLNQATREAFTDPQILQLLRTQNNRIAIGTPEQFREHIATEYERWRKVINESPELKSL